MDVTCPGCGKRGRIGQWRPGMVLSCPACKRRWQPGPNDGRLAGDRHEPRLPAEAPAEADDDARSRRGARLAGLALLAGIALPVVEAGSDGSGGSELAALGIWDFWSGLDSGTQTAVGVLAALAVLLIVLSFEGSSRVRSWLLLLAPLGVLVLHAICSSSLGGRMVGLGLPVLYLVTGLAAATLAAANRLRKGNAGSGLLRIATVVAGGIGLGLCFLPAPGGGPSIGAAALGSGESWTPWPPRAAFGLLLAYFASAALHLVPLATRPVSRLLSSLGRLAALALPVSLAVMPLLGDGPGTALQSVASAVAAIKSPMLLIYPALIAFGLALVPQAGGWIARAGAGRHTPVSSAAHAPSAPAVRPGAAVADLPPRRAAPEPPPAAPARPAPPPVVRPPAEPPKPDPELDELRRRMARLDTAYSEGLLTDEEYRAKRKDVLEGYKF